MKSFLIALVLVGGYSWVVHIQDFWGKLQAKADQVNGFEARSIELAKESRELRATIDKLRYEIKTLEAKNNFLEIKLGKDKARSIASLPAKEVENDLVNFEIYKWTVKDMLSMAQKEFVAKNYEKSAQFFNSLIHHYPKDKAINEEVLFQAGISAYETKKHNDWAIKHMGRLISEYPTSKFYRGAKLWTAMSYHEMGDKDKFFATVEEFRLKYRNTDEWKILSRHYESFYQKYK